MAPGDWVLRWLVSRTLSFYKKFALALQYVKEALTLNSGSAVLWLQAAECELALNLNVLAENSFRQAHQLDPGCKAAEAGLRRIQEAGLLDRFRSLFAGLFGKS
jgi:hypothetical protein